MTEPTNEERAAHAEAALEAYMAATGEPRDGTEEEIGDLITDLLHLAKREGGDAAMVLRCARRDFAAEDRDTVLGVAVDPTVTALVDSMQLYDRYPRRCRGARAGTWTRLFKLFGGHTYYRDDRGFVAVADGGANPDDSEGGCRYVVRERPIAIRGSKATIAVVDTNGGRGRIIESLRNALELAIRLDMAVALSANRVFSLNLETPHR